MSDATSQTVYFYDRHPISCEIILTKLRASRGHLDGLRPDELFPHDQDHYGGLAATDELARGAQVSKGSRVADFCAGLGGTVRYLAHKYGADVTGIELTPARVAGAQEVAKMPEVSCLFDHFVSASDQRRRRGQPERLCRLKIHD
jgi:sarcosine/dimethylglycine N-methyltransferase